MAGMSALGIGHPLLQLIRENPEFLVVHDSSGRDIIILSAALILLLPVLLSSLVCFAGLIQKRAGQFLHSLVLGGLLVLILLPMVDRISAVSGWGSLVLAFIPALVLVVFYGGSQFLRQNLSFLALAVPIFLALFFGSGPIRVLLFPGPQPGVFNTHSVNNPVVMIIFDEFPTSSLMGLDQEIDRKLFPNFSRLADRSTWYRNATTVSGATLRSVPAIMSGKFPEFVETPTLADHPQNIFTLLGSTHQILSLETQTNLCPDELKSEPVPGLIERLDLLFVDLTILYQHIVVPELWRKNLVPVSTQWGNFKGSEENEGKGGHKETKVEQFEKFVASLEVGDKPNLMVAHILLPHNPYQFFPNGQIYNWRKKVPSLEDGTWGPDQVLMAHSFRRHILQVGATDLLLGKLLDRLEELDLFDDAAIVVTADHGTSFRTGIFRRRFSEENVADIMCVPLFIKLPGQTIGDIDDRFAQTVDIMPTLVSGLGCDPEWNFDGMDLLSKRTSLREELLLMDQSNRIERKIDPKRMKDRDDTIRWKHELFGDDGGFERLFTLGDTGGFLGKNISGIQLKDHPTLRGRILDAQELEDVGLGGFFVPAEFNGTLDGVHEDDRPSLALAVNGIIAGVTQTYLDGPSPNTLNWQVTTNFEAFINGANKAELFLIPKSNSSEDLLRIPLFTPSFLETNLGGTRVSGIQEEGLFAPNDWGGNPVRWTNGKASWRIPLKKAENPKMLVLKIVSSGPPGADLSVTVNGTRLLSQVIPKGKWETRLPLGSIETNGHLTVVLESRVFVPSENNKKSKDQRKLGVAVSTLIVN